MNDDLLEFVPNVSEGRDVAAIQAIAEAFASAGATLLDVESDRDHHRSVITLAGTRREVVEGALAGTRAAENLIDLTTHQGAHPRMGAADVLPFVPLGSTSMEVAVAAARETAERVARELHIPTYLYGEAATRPERRDLAKIRSGEFEGIRDVISTDDTKVPDFGDRVVHPTAGTTAVGARFFLIAFNVNLFTRDVAVAKKIAKEIREKDGGMPAVKALGFDLPEKEQVQVSMNLVDYRKTSPIAAFDAVVARAREANVRVAGSELIGLIPEAACPTDFAKRVHLIHFDPDQVVEARLRRRRAARG